MHVVVPGQRRQSLAQPLERQSVERVDARNAQHDGGQPGRRRLPADPRRPACAAAGDAQLAFGVDAPPGPVGVRIDGIRFIDKGTLAVAVDTGRAEVDQPLGGQGGGRPGGPEPEGAPR